MGVWVDNKFILLSFGCVLAFWVSYLISWYTQEPVVVTHMEFIDGEVHYSRDVHRDFSGVWSVTIISQDSIVCRGSGYNYYEKGEVSRVLPLHYYTGDPECELPVGNYTMYTEWIPDKESLGRSFHVYRFQVEE